MSEEESKEPLHAKELSPVVSSKKRKIHDGSPEIEEQQHPSPKKEQLKKPKLPRFHGGSDTDDSDKEVRIQRQNESLRRIRQKVDAGGPHRQPISSGSSDDERSKPRARKSEVKNKVKSLPLKKSVLPPKEASSDSDEVVAIKEKPKLGSQKGGVNQTKVPKSVDAESSPPRRDNKAKSTTIPSQKVYSVSPDDSIRKEQHAAKTKESSKSSRSSDSLERSQSEIKKEPVKASAQKKLNGKSAYTLLQLSKEKSSEEDDVPVKVQKTKADEDEDSSSVSSTEETVSRAAKKMKEVDQQSAKGKNVKPHAGKKGEQTRSLLAEAGTDESADNSTEDPVLPSRNNSKNDVKVINVSKKKDSRKDAEKANEDNEGSLGSSIEELEDNSTKKAEKGKIVNNTKMKRVDAMPSDSKKSSQGFKKGSKGGKDGDDELGRYKSYLKEAGIRIQNYGKFFAGETSVKKQKDKILQTLKDNGLEGRPSLEACKRLKEKRETEAEIASLNQNLIITAPGRTRSTRGAVAEIQEKSEAKNRAAMLQKSTKQYKQKLADTDEEEAAEVDLGALAYKSDEESETDAFANLRDCIASDSE